MVKVPSPLPSRIVTVFSTGLATAMSSRPSPLKSAVTIAICDAPVEICSGGANVPPPRLT